MNTNNESTIDRIRSWFKQSLFIKTISIGFIMLLLMIPNTLIKEIIRERNYSQKDAIQEVSAKWGNEQQIIGPILTVPYKSIHTNADGETFENIKFSHFLPEQLSINANVNPNTRKRGIYNVILYQSNLDCNGSFGKIDLSQFGIQEEHVLWDKAYVVVSIPDMGGINDNIEMTFGEQKARMESGITTMNNIQSGVKMPISLDPTATHHAFNFSLDINGSKSINFAALGKETNVELSSTWASPSFNGAFLPDERQISEAGFTAKWKVLDLNRNYPQAWIGTNQNLKQSTFGLTLIQPVNEYAKNTRSAKYALLVISLTFLLFFFFEVINKQTVHPMHYILIGLAISVFYILLLSLSEHLGFNRAYLISTWATVGLIGAYSTTILSARKLVFILSGILFAIFGFIFVILQLEDFALLAGAIGLFAVLAMVMYFSRNIDWGNVGKGKVLKEI
jgi:inner membrane protein